MKLTDKLNAVEVTVLHYRYNTNKGNANIYVSVPQSSPGCICLGERSIYHVHSSFGILTTIKDVKKCQNWGCL